MVRKGWDREGCKGAAERNRGKAGGRGRREKGGESGRKEGERREGEEGWDRQSQTDTARQPAAGKQNSQLLVCNQFGENNSFVCCFVEDDC